MSYLTETEQDAAIGALIAERRAARDLARWTADPADGFDRADVVFDVSRRSLDMLADYGIVDAIAHSVGDQGDGIKWSCPMCWTAGPETDGEEVHNGYAHRAALSLEVSDGTGYWPFAVVVTITPADEWDRQTEDMAQDAAMRYPGITFTMACKCDRDDDGHDMGCGQTFETSAYNGATYVNAATAADLADLD